MTPLSTMLLCTKNCIQGAMVVPMVAMTIRTNAAVGMNVGTTVALSTRPQSGFAMKAATT